MQYTILFYIAVLDAIGRRPTGLYEGQFHWLGSYEECTTQVIHHTVRVRPGLLDPPENRTLRGKYARLDMPISLDVFGVSQLNRIDRMIDPLGK